MQEVKSCTSRLRHSEKQRICKSSSSRDLYPRAVSSVSRVLSCRRRRHLSAYVMYIYKQHQYFIYIVTNPERTVLYTGVTNNLSQRLIEHWMNRGCPKTFAGKYYCYNLIYFEEFSYIYDAIAREKEIKGWGRKKKLILISTQNPDLFFLNAQFCGEWPPKETPMRY